MKTKLTFTPGPWEVIQMHDLNGTCIVATTACDGVSNICEINTSISKYKKNANLIAAAPELLEIAKSVLGVIEEGENFHCTENNRKWLEAIIAKAEGSAT